MITFGLTIILFSMLAVNQNNKRGKKLCRRIEQYKVDVGCYFDF